MDKNSFTGVTVNGLPAAALHIRHNDGRLLLEIRSDGTVIADGLRPADETARLVVETLVPFLKQALGSPSAATPVPDADHTWEAEAMLTTPCPRCGRGQSREHT